MPQPEFVLMLRQGQVADALRLAQNSLRDGADPATTYAAHLTLGRVAAAEGAWAQAEAAIAAALETDLKAIEAPLLLASVLLDQGRIEKALAVLGQLDRSAAEQDPAWFQLQARLATGVGEPQRAVDFLRRALALDDENRALPMLLATSLAEAGQIEEAADYLIARCRSEPDDAPQWRVAASLQSTARGPGAALALLQEASQACADPGILMQLLSTAAVNRAFDQIPEAVERAKQLGRDNPDLRRALGTFYLAADKVEAALHQFEKAYAAKPEIADLRRSFANALLRKAAQSTARLVPGLKAQARGLLEEQRAAEPSDWRASNDLAALLLSGEPAERARAEDLLDDILAQGGPERPEVLLNRAVLLAARQEYKAARKLVKRVRELAPEHSPAALQAAQLMTEIKTLRST